MKWNPFNSRIGLALGGGAAKGLAHVGVLKAFEARDLKISCISGTSAGALVASYYAFGIPVDKISTIGNTLNIRTMMSFTFKRMGLLDDQAIREMLLTDIGDVLIEDAKIPLAIVAADIHTGEKKIFQQGSLVDAVCASMAAPGLFAPVVVDGHTYVDGGILENVPITPLEKMGAGIIVGVDLNGVADYPKTDSMLDVIVNAIDISIDLRTREQLKQADVVISLNLSAYKRLDNTEKSHELFLEGFNLANRQLSRLTWYKRTNYLHYLLKVVENLIPIKVPQLFKVTWQKWQERRRGQP